MEARLAAITRAKGWLDAFRPLPPSVVAEMQGLYDVRLTYHSKAIEGNTLTQAETALVLEKGITVGGKTLAEHLEAVGHKEALEYVREVVDEPFTPWTLRELHALVLRGADFGDSGRYRTLDVRAAGTEHVYPSHLQVPELMDRFFAWLIRDEGHPVVRASGPICASCRSTHSATATGEWGGF